MDEAELDAKKLKRAEHLIRRDALESEALFKELIASPHVGARAKGLLGVLYLEQGKRSDAERLFKSVIDAGDKVAEAFYGLGVIHEPADPGYARAQYESALRINPKHAGSLARIKKLEAALDIAKSTAKTIPTSSVSAAGSSPSEPHPKTEKLLIEGNALPGKYVLRYVLISCVLGYFLIWSIDLFNTPIFMLLGIVGILAWVIVSELNRRRTLYRIFEGRIEVMRGATTKNFGLSQVISIEMRQSMFDKLQSTAGLYIAHALPNGKPEHVFIPTLASAIKMKEVAQSWGALHTTAKGESGDPIGAKSPLNYEGVATDIRSRNEQRGNPARQFQIIEFSLQRANGLKPVHVYMGNYRVKGVRIKEGDKIVLKGRMPKAGTTYETNRVYNKTADGYVEMLGKTDEDINFSRVVGWIGLLVAAIVVISLVVSAGDSGNKRRRTLHEPAGTSVAANWGTELAPIQVSER